MLTRPRVSIPTLPCSTRVMFNGRIKSDGNATVRSLVFGSYFLEPLKSRKKGSRRFPFPTFSKQTAYGKRPSPSPPETSGKRSLFAPPFQL